MNEKYDAEYAERPNKCGGGEAGTFLPKTVICIFNLLKGGIEKTGESSSKV